MSHDLTLQVRIGIATGVVVVGDLIGEGASQEQGVVGETPNLAARLQALAEPGQVFISESTRRLTGGMFEYQNLGNVALKGLTSPVQAWQVTGTSAVQSRFEAHHAANLTPLVGREEELELLSRRWRQAVNGEGRVVLASGEPGIGKSRLTVALSERLQTEPHTRLRFFCSPQHTDSALYPVIAQLERAAGFERHDTPGTKFDKLSLLLNPTKDVHDDLRLLAELLSIGASGLYEPVDLTPQRKKEKTFEALLRQLEVLSCQQPVLAVYEDVHWIDPSTRELLDMMVECVTRLPVLLVITFRPEFQPPWSGQAQVSAITLSRLGQREGSTLVQRIAGNEGLPDWIKTEIVDRTDGVPLFVEELTKAILEATARNEDGKQTLSMTSPSALAVPATLHASLMARLDHLGPVAKEIAQIGAVIGREFSYELLAPVARHGVDVLRASLDQLEKAGLVFRRGELPKVTLLFKHALVRDAAYGSLLRNQRQEFHARVAASLEGQFPDVVAMQPELLAQHCIEAGWVEKATNYWLSAGQRAVRRSATTESVAHFAKGMETLATLPDTPARDRQEVRFRLALGPALIATRGWNSIEAEDSYRRALTLCDRLGEQRGRFDALWGLWLTSGTSELKKAQKLATELSDTADSLDEDDLRLQAHHASWTTFIFLGEPKNAREHQREGLRIYDPEKHKHHAFSYGGHDPGVCGKGQGSLALWMLGYPDQAVRSADEAISIAETLKHVPSLAHALMAKCAFCDVPRRDDLSAHQCGDRLITLATQQGLALYLALGTLVRGWSLVHQGRILDGLPAVRKGFAQYCEIGRLLRPYFGAVLADALLIANEAEQGLTVLTDALSLAKESHEAFWLAEMLNLRGKFLLLADNRAEAERSFERAIDLAREQSAFSLQLRAASSLARLWRDQGKRTEARDLLGPIFGWFTEGFDTPDLKEAKALLDMLG